MTLEELTQTLRMAAVNENTITAMTNAYNLGFEAAQLEEREACARIADSWLVNVVWEVKQIAKNIGIEIRARGQHEGH